MTCLRRLKNRKGFTLVELIVVIAIIAILAAIAVPLVSGYVEDAKESTVDGNHNVLLSACNVAYAATEAGLATTGTNTFALELQKILGVAPTMTNTTSGTYAGTVVLGGGTFTFTQTDGVFAITDPA